MKSNCRRAVVCLSGGMDSTTALYWARKNFDEVLAFGVSYGSKHNRRERDMAHLMCKKIGVSFSTYDLPQYCSEFKDSAIGDQRPFLRSDLLESGGDIPYGHYAEESMKKTVVPFRNGIILSLAVGFAESRDANTVVLGNHAGDHAIYPDCRPEFVDAFTQAAGYGTFNNVALFSPFCNLTKADIVRTGLYLDVPFELTWSCYEGKARPCFRCGTCMERTLSFWEAGVPDPLLTSEEWTIALDIALKIQKNFEEQNGR